MTAEDALQIAKYWQDLLAPLTRYDIYPGFDREIEIEATPEGNWVLFGDVRAALSHAPAPDALAAPPREPTEEMIKYGLQAMMTNNVRDSSEQGRIKRIWQAMYNRAPGMP